MNRVLQYALHLTDSLSQNNPGIRNYLILLFSLMGTLLFVAVIGDCGMLSRALGASKDALATNQVSERSLMAAES